MARWHCPTKKWMWASRVPVLRPSSSNVAMTNSSCSCPHPRRRPGKMMHCHSASQIFFLKEIVCKSLSVKAGGLNLCSQSLFESLQVLARQILLCPLRSCQGEKGRRIICIGCGVVGDCGAHKSLHSITCRVRGSHVYRATPGQVLEIVPIEKRGPGITDELQRPAECVSYQQQCS